MKQHHQTVPSQPHEEDARLIWKNLHLKSRSYINAGYGVIDQWNLSFIWLYLIKNLPIVPNKRCYCCPRNQHRHLWHLPQRWYNSLLWVFAHQRSRKCSSFNHLRLLHIYFFFNLGCMCVWGRYVHVSPLRTEASAPLVLEP